MSKMFIGIALVVATLGAPVLSFAQSSAPLTRAQVRADMIRVEQAGYNPSRGNDINYPADIQAAEAKIVANDERQLATQDVGGVVQNGSTDSGSVSHTSTHQRCVGPVSFCNVYFGS